MKSYIYSEARENFAEVLDTARTEPVRITRRNGECYTLTFVQSPKSPFDVPGVHSAVTLADILEAVAESREGWPGRYGMGEAVSTYGPAKATEPADVVNIVQRGERFYEEREGRPLRPLEGGRDISIIGKGDVIPAGKPPHFNEWEFHFQLSESPSLRWLEMLHEALCAPWHPAMPYFLDRTQPPLRATPRLAQRDVPPSPLTFRLKFEQDVMALVCTHMILEPCFNEIADAFVQVAMWKGLPPDPRSVSDAHDRQVLAHYPGGGADDPQTLANWAENLRTSQQLAQQCLDALPLSPRGQ